MENPDPIILKPTTESFPAERAGHLTSEPPIEMEVGGREIVVRAARCGNCGYTGWINYDTINYRVYQCNACGGHGAF